MNQLKLLAQDLDTPALILDIDILKANLKKMSDICDQHGVSIRPHAKTHRIPEIGRIQVENGAEGLCVAKLGEAEGFADFGIKKITVAYPVVGEDKAKRALALSEKVELVLAADSVEGASSLGKIFFDAGKEVDLLLIINTGLNRDGVLPQEAGKIGFQISKLDGCNLIGLLTHEGSVYQSKNKEELKENSISVAEKMLEAAEDMQKYGLRDLTVSMGASASAKYVATVPGINQIRPGIYAFNDLGQVALGNADFSDCAATVLSSVVSTPTEYRAIIDAGSKSLSKDLLPTTANSDKFSGHGYIINQPGWVIARLSEEHGILEWQGEGKPAKLNVGQKLMIVPNHICTVFSSLNECFVSHNGEIIDNWKTLQPGASR